MGGHPGREIEAKELSLTALVGHLLQQPPGAEAELADAAPLRSPRSHCIKQCPHDFRRVGGVAPPYLDEVDAAIRRREAVLSRSFRVCVSFHFRW